MSTELICEKGLQQGTLDRSCALLCVDLVLMCVVVAGPVSMSRSVSFYKPAYTLISVVQV